MRTKKAFQIIVSGLCLGFTFPAFAIQNEPCMNRVSMNFTAEEWVNSQSSLVRIGISASLPASEVDKMTDTIKTKLASISKKKDWHLMNVTRTESDAGLITFTGQAVTRLNNDELSALQAQLKTLNKPGERYAIDDIDSEPELSTINQARIKLRKKLYTQAIDGQKELNVALPKTRSPYQIYNISFNDMSSPSPVAYAASNNIRTAQKKRTSNPTLISDKLYMAASVIYAANTEICNP